jgi:para-nitrobenzyl esterase
MREKALLLLLTAICFFNFTAFYQAGDAIKAGEDIAITLTDNGKVSGCVYNGIFNLMA